MAALPSGTVTFLFTDIEGSTRLLKQLGDRYAEALAEYRRLLLAAVRERHGREINTQGDACFIAFPRATQALAAAVAAQRALLAQRWPERAPVRVRMGLHTGEPLSAGGEYVGMDVHRASRIGAAGHGGQILLSETTHALVVEDLPEGISLRDLGRHRLRDLAHPVHVFQVVGVGLPTEFPPLRSLDVHPHNLPVQLTSFVGREREIAEVKQLLSTAHLLTLTGSGGAGKTRLALQVAADVLQEFPGGVWLVELAALSDPGLVPKTIASTLGVPEQPGRPIRDSLLDSLRSKSLLLLLDNCEHLLATCASLADSLLRACPNLRILATSREALGTTGELTYRVPSLSLPDLRRLPPLEDVTQHEAVRLFVERALFIQPGFRMTASNAAAVVQACHRLDGIPLAIELAAARVKVLAVEQIAARLDDRFRLLIGGSRTVLPRHQTLRATMDWSYDLLSDTERALLRRLSVFAGGWTLEAAEAICSGDGVDESEILDLLAQLVDKSLVVVEMQAGEARYRLLETVRQYGLDRLRQTEEAACVRRRHFDWHLAFAERAAPRLRGPEQVVWLDRLETEHDNLRAALEWGKSGADDREALARLAAGLHWFWNLHGHWGEGREWIEEALSASSEAPLPVRIKVLVGAAHLAYRRGDYDRSILLCRQGLAISRELGDKEGTATFLTWLGYAMSPLGDYPQVAAHLEAALDLAREIGDQWLISVALSMLGNVVMTQGDYERAAALHTEELARSRAVGDTHRIAASLRNLGRLAIYQGEYGQAAILYKESLILAREVESSWVIETCLVGLAGVASARGHHEQAARLLGATEPLREVFGRHRSPADQANYDQRMAAARAALGNEAFTAAWEAGRAMPLERAIEYALANDEA